jgi:shikimate kinase
MHQQEQLLKFKNIKLYLARFTPKTEDNLHLPSSEVKTFYKIGVTSKFDAAERFTDEEYALWDVKIMTTAYGPTLKVLEEETKLLKKHPKNLWIDQKIKGVTEIFTPHSKQEINDLIKHITRKRKEWYAERHNIPLEQEV